MKIGIYGGTFNPIHRGHLTAARAAMDALGLDRLLLIPASVPPHKALPQGSAEPAFDAYLGELLRAGFASLERGLIRDDGKAPRTFCLLRKLHCAEEPNHE